MALSINALTTVARVQEDLSTKVGDGGAPSEGRLEPIIEAVSEGMAEFCNRLFAYEADRVEEVWAREHTFLRLKRAPIISVSTVQVIDREGNVSFAIEDSEIFEDGAAGLLFRENQWAGPTFFQDPTFVRTGRRSRIRVTYTGGYVTPTQETSLLPRTLPLLLEELCIREVTRAWRSRLRDPDVDSRSTADTTVTFREAGGLTRRTKEQLKRHWLGDV